VRVTFLAADAERAVTENVLRKEAGVAELTALRAERTRALWAPGAALADILAAGVAPPPAPEPELRVAPGGARLILGDCVAGMQAHLAEGSVDYCVFSPPFQSLYRYSEDARDLSNVQDDAQFEAHMGFVAAELLRVLKPGRLLSFHCMNLSRSKREAGAELAGSLKDLRGQLVRVFEAAGFLLHSELAVYRCPKLALVQTKAPSLWHNQYVRDAAACRQALPDYVVTLRKPGANAAPIAHAAESAGAPELPEGDAADAKDAAVLQSRARWVELASPFWCARAVFAFGACLSLRGRCCPRTPAPAAGFKGCGPLARKLAS
jgi:hypothetical protein